jgi:hypothetical protein
MFIRLQIRLNEGPSIPGSEASDKGTAIKYQGAL